MALVGINGSFVGIVFDWIRGKLDGQLLFDHSPGNRIEAPVNLSLVDRHGAASHAVVRKSEIVWQ